MLRNNLLKAASIILIVVVGFFISCNFVFAATYNATGTWSVYWYNRSQCSEPIEPETYLFEINQDVDTFTWTHIEFGIDIYRWNH